MDQEGYKLCELGWHYQFGVGVEKDVIKAFKYYLRAANMGNSEGIFQIGEFYYLGIGVKINKRKAFLYFRSSAKLGNLMGIFKTAICYYYGIGVLENEIKFKYWNEKDYYIDDHIKRLFDHNGYIGFKRHIKFEECEFCNKPNTNFRWCLTCDPDLMIQSWTSGNKNTDDCLKIFQLRSTSYDDMIEWIPFDKLDSIEKIGQGGYGTVYSATWSDGIRMSGIAPPNIFGCLQQSDLRGRFKDKHMVTVALKTLSNFNETSSDLREFKIYRECDLIKVVSNKRLLKIYGLTQNPKTKEYMMVFQHADGGNLYNFLRANFQNLDWHNHIIKSKLKLLLNISEDLTRIHKLKYIHSDLHGGNILLDKRSGTTIFQRAFISDLGLAKKYDEINSVEVHGVLSVEVHGVLPYVAPEVLSGQKLTQAADIYSFGVIMSEISTGRRAFDGISFDNDLAARICLGLRPEFAPGTPDCYIELATRCMDADPQKRPDAESIYIKINEWIFKPSKEIAKQFSDANMVKPKVIEPKHLLQTYTSKLIDTQEILNILNSYGEK